MTREEIDARVRDVRAFMASASGPFILHLSDTATDQYPLAQALLEAVRPRLAVHTGDMADEFKVGRVVAHLPGYRAALPTLLDAIERCSGRVICTPGNNDDFSALEDRAKIAVVPNGARIEELGVRMELDHIAVPATWGVDFALYGHGPTDDLRYSLPDEPDAPVYLNGNYFWTVIDAPTKRFLRVPCRPASPCLFPPMPAVRMIRAAPIRPSRRWDGVRRAFWRRRFAGYALRGAFSARLLRAR